MLAAAGLLAGCRGRAVTRRGRLKAGCRQNCLPYLADRGRIHDKLLLLDGEAVQVAIERCDVDAAVGHGKPGPMVPGSDLVAARPQLFTGPRVQRVKSRVRRARYAAI